METEQKATNLEAMEVSRLQKELMELKERQNWLEMIKDQATQAAFILSKSYPPETRISLVQMAQQHVEHIGMMHQQAGEAQKKLKNAKKGKK